MVDCILSFAATELVGKMSDPNNAEGREMLEKVATDPRASRQLLLLAHLYAKVDAASLAHIRAALLRPKWSATQVSVALGIGAVVGTGKHPQAP